MIDKIASKIWENIRLPGWKCIINDLGPVDSQNAPRVIIPRLQISSLLRYSIFNLSK